MSLVPCPPAFGRATLHVVFCTMLLIPIIGGCSRTRDDLLTVAVTLTSVEGTYWRTSPQTPHYDLEKRRVVGTCEYLSEDGQIFRVIGLEDTEVAGEDYEGYARMLFQRYTAGKCYIEYQVENKRDGYAFDISAEAAFVEGSWEAYERGDEVKVVFTPVGLEHVSRQLAYWMTAKIHTAARSTEGSVAGDGSRVVRIETTVDRVSMSNDPIIVTWREIRVTRTSPSRVTLNLRATIESDGSDWSWVIVGAIVVCMAVALGRLRHSRDPDSGATQIFA